MELPVGPFAVLGANTKDLLSVSHRNDAPVCTLHALGGLRRDFAAGEGREREGEGREEEREKEREREREGGITNRSISGPDSSDLCRFSKKIIHE